MRKPDMTFVRHCAQTAAVASIALSFAQAQRTNQPFLSSDRRKPSPPQGTPGTSGGRAPNQARSRELSRIHEDQGRHRSAPEVFNFEFHSSTASAASQPAGNSASPEALAPSARSMPPAMSAVSMSSSREGSRPSHGTTFHCALRFGHAVVDPTRRDRLRSGNSVHPVIDLHRPGTFSGTGTAAAVFSWSPGHFNRWWRQSLCGRHWR